MKSTMMKKILSMGMVVALTLGLAACGSGASGKKEDKKKEEKKVVEIGAYGAHVPFNYMEDDELVGYEVDIWKEIAKRNNLELNYTISSDVAGLFTISTNT